MKLKPLDLYSEPYGSTGNIGENFRRLLGAPSIDPLHTVVRESVQNIADAAKLNIGPEIALRLRNLDSSEQNAMAKTVFANLPAEPESRDQLSRFLDRKKPVVLEVCDFRTVGLGGPTRADRIPVETTQTDFIDFLRNIGSPRDTELGGGTYGFGKVALYRASLCSTILVDTLPANPDEGRRLIGCHVGHSFERPEDGMKRRYTGRHWWGTSDENDGVVDPATGNLASELTSSLGFLDRNQDSTGTSIMILDFDTDGEEIEVLGARLVEAMLWNFWPRMMDDAPKDKKFDLSIEVNGEQLDIPSCDDFPPIELFAKAFRSIRSKDKKRVRKISSQRPIATLGSLACMEGLRAPRHPLVLENSVFPDPSRHIALMRPVELVVKYLEGEPLPDERLEWAGVFMTSDEDEIEQAFADSEPPAHDDWISDNLPKPAKTYVNVALRELRNHAWEMGNIGQKTSTNNATGPPLARLAGRLGAALESVGGDGAGRNRSSSGGGRSQRPPVARATPPVFQKLEHENGLVVAVFQTQVLQDRKRSGKRLILEAGISIEGSTIGQSEELVENPVISQVTNTSTGESMSSSIISLDGAEGEFEVRVRMPRDCAVVLNAQVETGE